HRQSIRPVDAGPETLRSRLLPCLPVGERKYRLKTTGKLLVSPKDRNDCNETDSGREQKRASKSPGTTAPIKAKPHGKQQHRKINAPCCQPQEEAGNHRKAIGGDGPNEECGGPNVVDLADVNGRVWE